MITSRRVRLVALARGARRSVGWRRYTIPPLEPRFAAVGDSIGSSAHDIA